MKLLSSFTFFCGLLLAPIGTLIADTQDRGFQIAFGAVYDSQLQTDINNDQFNTLRIQIGNDGEMDGTTGDDYVALMEAVFDDLDEKLPLYLQNDLKIVLALYSPPGGFESRTAPSHYAMFSSAALQDEYVDMWVRIACRYRNVVQNGNFVFDLLNEPALNKSRAPEGVPDWNDLLLETISAIRAVDEESCAEYPETSVTLSEVDEDPVTLETVDIMVKSLYGDYNKLRALPIITDTNIIYSYHFYPNPSYQAAGFGTDPFSESRPSAKSIKNKLLKPLALFFKQQKVRYKNGKAGNYPPRLNVGETAVSSCASGSSQYLDDVLAFIERDDKEAENFYRLDECKTLTNRKQKKKCRRKKKKAKKNKRQRWLLTADDVEHESWTFHGIYEAKIWDPRYSCTEDGEFYLTGNSERYDVLRKYFSRNE